MIIIGDASALRIGRSIFIQLPVEGMEIEVSQKMEETADFDRIGKVGLQCGKRFHMISQEEMSAVPFAPGESLSACFEGKKTCLGLDVGFFQGSSAVIILIPGCAPFDGNSRFMPNVTGYFSRKGQISISSILVTIPVCSKGSPAAGIGRIAVAEPVSFQVVPFDCHASKAQGVFRGIAFKG